jgi:hypothetical protein
MADPRQGRAGSANLSPRLGRRDPRARTNAAGAVSETGVDRKTVGTDGSGRARVAAADGLKPVSPTATLSEVIAAHNLLLARLRGQ